MGVQIVLNLAFDTAREAVTNGDIVDFRRLGTLSPSFSCHCDTSLRLILCSRIDGLMTIRS